MRAFNGEITNHDSAILLGKEEDFEGQELQRLTAGQAPSPKFRGAPTREVVSELPVDTSASVGWGGKAK